MDDLGVPGPLQAALADKGYDRLTPVQEAVLAEGLAGRDLLVSAQTGSGKTVAFGLAIAPEVLGGVDALLPAEKPLALVVAPTRELAQQVAREFQWLYAPAGVQLATCVGGMDYRTERRALERGAHVVVGTPGRLRDHIERGSLDLSEARAVVLDEADEMLDLGFAEDLEFILGSAPETRRTLMFSATVPKEIEKLAASFQKDAERVVVQGEAKQHSDIAYQALSVQARDKEHAIFNVLRFHEAATAIVFCKTRANVNHLFARMVNRGFQVVALSGELSQSERMHALQALRDGRARVCIATDVAARGIDLPGLELVIHADLPSNSEVLLHRSGRTGRAGRKGTSVLVVPPAEMRKAQRLLQGAKLVADWGKAPSAEEVQAREDQRLLEHEALAAGAGEEAGMAADLLDRWGPEAVAAAFVRLWRSGRSAPEVLSDSLPPPAPLPPRERGEFGPSVWYRIPVGHTGRAEARWLLPKICDAGGIAKDGIGAIRVQQDVTYVQLAAPLADRFGDRVELDRDLPMERIEGEPDLGRPAPRVGARPEGRPAPRREKAPYQPKPSRFVEEGEEPREAARKSWPKRDEGEERRPYARREEGEERPRPAREAAERKPYAPRGDGERKPWAPRGDGERKPYAPREGAERKPYAPRDGERKPYAPRGDAERKPYAPRGEGEAAKKPRWTPEERAAKGAAPSSREKKPPFKSAGFKSHGGEGRPARAAGYKSHADAGEGRKPWAAKGEEARPYARKEGGAKPAGKPEGRSWGAKSHGDAGGKPAYAKGDKPGPKKAPFKVAPKTDARDTSKRFVPPKKKG
ncbi:DEAD/DEAH box helicase [Rhodobacter sp. SGA-6-6]|uniref:DEAD/DEAH box helicase n=1 Tax=Rhodobacter sp. SGA-6-6 TaxID=2710882 RepID=UPI0013EB4CEB|nr:DEAD/DEAH box helicase [Rhodobacter sp. SGA-6-6]NGM45791.1 DEAD/DEAH box helicase [Rhodobacter sp. SGA-6-6]